LKKLLSELRDEEENHKKLLLELAEGPAVEQEPMKVTDLRISDYLVAEPPHPDTSPSTARRMGSRINFWLVIWILDRRS